MNRRDALQALLATLAASPGVLPNPAGAQPHVQLPVVSGWYNYPEAGGLVSYGPNMGQAWRRAADIFDRVAKGADPATTPIELPTIVELVINLKTAKALGLKVSPTLLARADRVIE